MCVCVYVCVCLSVCAYFIRKKFEKSLRRKISYLFSSEKPKIRPVIQHNHFVSCSL